MGTWSGSRDRFLNFGPHTISGTGETTHFKCAASSGSRYFFAPQSHSERSIMRLTVLWYRWLLVISLVGWSRLWTVSKPCVGGLQLLLNMNRLVFLESYFWNQRIDVESSNAFPSYEALYKHAAARGPPGGRHDPFLSEVSEAQDIWLKFVKDQSTFSLVRL